MDVNALIENKMIAVLTETVGKIAEQARSNARSGNIPRDIADAISVSEVSRTNDGLSIQIVVDVGNDNRQGRAAARAYEFGSGIHRTRLEAPSTYPITPKAGIFQGTLKFEWHPHDDSFPIGGKVAGLFGDQGFYMWYVDHPGVEKKPYLDPAIKAYRETLIKLMANVFIETHGAKGNTSEIYIVRTG